MISKLNQRKCDPQGCGHYGAPRGRRKHKGVDLASDIGDPVQLGFGGEVTKVGWPYADQSKSHIRYVAVKPDCQDVLSCLYNVVGVWAFRVFYVAPNVKVGDIVSSDTIIGHTQDLVSIYSGITNHVHVELYFNNKNYVNPALFLRWLSAN